MNISQFLSKASPAFFDGSKSVLYFKGSSDSYPLLFFSMLCNRIKQTAAMSFSFMDVQAEDFNMIQAKLETTFLGERTFYWLKSAVDLDEKKRKQLNAYLAQYQGPNIVGVFVALESQTSPEGVEIIVDPLIDQKTFTQLVTYLSVNSTLATKQLMDRVFKQNDMIPLDTACLLMSYGRVLGSNSEYFISSWLEKILTPERSLFTLSTYFFAKKGQLFFKEWSRIRTDYSEQFWIAFWSEQLWRAYHFVEYTRAKQPAMAKKIAHRLPFTFMQRDWQQFKVNELRNAHHYLYEIDSALKNSGDPVGFDLFYSKFFLSDFQKI